MNFVTYRKELSKVQFKLDTDIWNEKLCSSAFTRIALDVETEIRYFSGLTKAWMIRKRRADPSLRRWWISARTLKRNGTYCQAPVPLTVFRSNFGIRSKFVTVVRCVIFRCDRLNILWKSFIGFRIRSKYRSLLGLLSWYPVMPLLEYLPSLGRSTTIHLRIGHPYISSADVRPSNGFRSLAYNKDATVVVPAVAAVGRPPSSESCIMYSLIACACYSSSGGPHASGLIWP